MKEPEADENGAGKELAELRERLAHFARDNIALFDCTGDCPDEVAIKAEAGINLLSSPDTCNYCFANKILAIIKEAGYVKLAKDQRTPQPNGYYSDDYWDAQADMLKAGFRKVEL